MTRPLLAVQYEVSPRSRRPSTSARVALIAGLVAIILLATTIFIWHRGDLWGPYLSPPVTIGWARPMGLASLGLGTIALCASGIALMRPASVTSKIAAVTTPLAYWAGVGCVVGFELL